MTEQEMINLLDEIRTIVLGGISDKLNHALSAVDLVRESIVIDDFEEQSNYSPVLNMAEHYLTQADDDVVEIMGLVKKHIHKLSEMVANKNV